MLLGTDQNDTYLTLPENVLRKKIGSISLDGIFTPERIKACQQMLEAANEEFIEEMEEQLKRIGDECTKMLREPAQDKDALPAIAETLRLFKKRMESLNFAFGYEVTHSLAEVIKGKNMCAAAELRVICTHIAVLNIILKERIAGDGGDIGREMTANLKSLVQTLHK